LTRCESTPRREDVTVGRVTPIAYVANAKFQSYERNSKPERARFSGTDTEKTYLLYFATGDLRVSKRGRCVRVEMTTTHSAQLTLLSNLLGTYARPILYPIKNPSYFPKWSRLAWRIVYDLDESFHFLMQLPKSVDEPTSGDDRLFYTALTGFADAEGYVGLKKSQGHAYAYFSVSNKNRRICNDFLAGLRKRGFSSLVCNRPRADGSPQWELEVHGTNAVALLERLDFRHPEKDAAKKITIENNRHPWVKVGPAYRALRERIRKERNSCVLAARRAYGNKNAVRQAKFERYKEVTRTVWIQRLAGLRPIEIAMSLGMSWRTVYRRLSRTEIIHE
ncbi:MAG: hypothetical protein HYZ12_00730, partial [Thaumarchaeota archaeon]|nr:hypothetical protein [Nitrososphaerota archaeon]